MLNISIATKSLCVEIVMKKIKLLKDRCIDCHKRILSNKLAFLNKVTYCSDCFMKKKRWGNEHRLFYKVNQDELGKDIKEKYKIGDSNGTRKIH